VNAASLYKLEQRLACAARVDGAALARAARDGGAAPPPDALPLGAVAAAARWWFGANGLMLAEPDPLKVGEADPCWHLTAGAPCRQTRLQQPRRRPLPDAPALTRCLLD
jgi:hypothetical protein